MHRLSTMTGSTSPGTRYDARSCVYRSAFSCLYRKPVSLKPRDPGTSCIDRMPLQSHHSRNTPDPGVRPMTSNAPRNLWYPTTGILMSAFASTIAVLALWLKIGTRHGGHGGLGEVLIFAFGVVLIAGYVMQLLSMPLAMIAMYRHPSLRSGFPATVLAISCIHIALASFYFY